MVATAKSVASLCRDPSLQLHAMFSLTVCSMSRIRLRHGHLLSVEQHSLVEANDVNLVKYYFLSLHCKKNDEKVMY